MKLLSLLLLLVSCSRNHELDKITQSLDDSISSLEFSRKELECVTEIFKTEEQTVREQIFYNEKDTLDSTRLKIDGLTLRCLYEKYK